MRQKSKIILVSILLLGIFTANFASAAIVNCGGRDAQGNPQAECTLPDLVQTVLNIINFLLSWAWLIAVLFIVWAGWGMVNAGGNDEKISVAKTTLTHAIIGFFLILAAFVLINFILSILSGDGTPRAGTLIDAFNLLGP